MNLTKKEYNQEPLTPSQVDKIGNALIFLSEKINPLYKTSALKLLYLLEEISIRRYGIPFFGVGFQLWRFGPVLPDIYVDLTETTVLLDRYIKKHTTNENTTIQSRLPFNDDEFSDTDMSILELVVEKFGGKTGQELVNITHREDGPWYKTAKETGYLEIFENKEKNATDIILDLSSLLDESPIQKEFYENTLVFQRQSSKLKRHH